MNSLIALVVLIVAPKFFHVSADDCSLAEPEPFCAVRQNPGLFQPVTFDSQCELDLINSSLQEDNQYYFIHNHECTRTIRNQAFYCNVQCPKVYAQVCGSLADGVQRTFASLCILRSENCRRYFSDDPLYDIIDGQAACRRKITSTSTFTHYSSTYPNFNEV